MHDCFYIPILSAKKVQGARRYLASLTFMHTYLTHPVNTEHCVAQYNADSLIVISLSECNGGTVKKLCF